MSQFELVSYQYLKVPILFNGLFEKSYCVFFKIETSLYNNKKDEIFNHINKNIFNDDYLNNLKYFLQKMINHLNNYSVYRYVKIKTSYNEHLIDFNDYRRELTLNDLKYKLNIYLRIIKDLHQTFQFDFILNPEMTVDELLNAIEIKLNSN